MAEASILTFENLRGVNTKKSITQQAPNDAYLALNGFLDLTGAFVKRRGYFPINETEISTNFDINSVYQYDDAIIVAGSTNELIKYQSGSETVISSSITGSFFDFEEIIPNSINYLVGTNGKDKPFKYDNTTYTNLSIDPPNTLPTLTASAAGGSLTASSTYLVSVTFLRDNGSGEIQESNPCTTGSSAPYTITVSVTLGAGDNRIVVTNIPVSSDTQVTGRNIYLSRPNGAILYKIGTSTDATIPDNVTTTLNITANIDVLENSELEYDHDPAPLGYLIEKYKNRLIISGNEDFPDRVYVSQANNVWYFPQGTISDQKLYFAIGEKVKSIKSYYDLVLIFGEKGGMYILQGDSEENFTLSQIKNDERVTALADRATLTIDNWCYFLSYDGYYRTNGQIIQKVSEPISAFFDPENNFNTQYNVNGFTSEFNEIGPCAIYYKNLSVIYLWITQANQNDYVNNVRFALHLHDMVQDGDVILPNFSIDTGIATRCTALYVANNFPKYFITSQNDGFLFECEKGKFDGSAVNSTATSGSTTTLTDTTQTWVVNAYAQMWVIIRSGSGAGQIALIASNTVDTLTFAHAIDDAVDGSSGYSIGGIYYQYTHSYTPYGNKSLTKRLLYTRPRFITEGDATITVGFGYDCATVTNTDSEDVEVFGESQWDVSEWDVAEWDGTQMFDSLIEGKCDRLHRWITVQISNYYADQAVEYDGHDKIYEMKGIQP